MTREFRRHGGFLGGSSHIFLLCRQYNSDRRVRKTQRCVAPRIRREEERERERTWKDRGKREERKAEKHPASLLLAGAIVRWVRNHNGPSGRRPTGPRLDQTDIADMLIYRPLYLRAYPTYLFAFFDQVAQRPANRIDSPVASVLGRSRIRNDRDIEPRDYFPTLFAPTTRIAHQVAVAT